MSDQQPKTITEALAMTLHGDKVELIPASNGIVLLRIKLLQEFAYLMHVEIGVGTASLMYLKDSEGRQVGPLRVVCACCKDGNGNLSTKVVEDACRTHGIKVVFVRRMDSWKTNYGTSKPIKMVEASQARIIMEAIYNDEVVHEARQFMHHQSNAV